MVSTSARLGLRVPDTTDPFLTSDFQTNWAKVDNYPGVFTTTSSSRPGSPWIGQHVYETDTGQTIVWDGVHWGAPVSNLAWVWWAGVSPWLTSSGPISSPPVTSSYYTYGAHKFRIPTSRTNQAVILSGAMTLEIEDPQPPGATNFAGVYISINGVQLPLSVATASAMDSGWELFPYNRPDPFDTRGWKITMAINTQVIMVGTGSTNAKLNQDNSINVKLQNGFWAGRVRGSSYTLQMHQVTLGPGSNKAPGGGAISTTAVI